MPAVVETDSDEVAAVVEADSPAVSDHPPPAKRLTGPRCREIYWNVHCAPSAWQGLHGDTPSHLTLRIRQISQALRMRVILAARAALAALALLIVGEALRLSDDDDDGAASAGAELESEDGGVILLTSTPAWSTRDFGAGSGGAALVA